MTNPECISNRYEDRYHEPIRKETTVYVVGKFVLVYNKGLLELEGIFTDYNRAVEACKTIDHFVGPVPLNQQLPDGDWPGLYYPIKDGQ